MTIYIYDMFSIYSISGCLDLFFLIFLGVDMCMRNQKSSQLMCVLPRSLVGGMNGTNQGSLDYPFWENQTMQMYDNSEGFPLNSSFFGGGNQYNDP